MKVDPVIVSLVALGVSSLSLIISSYGAAADRRIQWEQLRGDMQVRLTTRGMELLALTGKLRRIPGDHSDALTTKLIHIANGIVHIRETLKQMEVPPLFRATKLITSCMGVKTRLDDADPVFDRLRSEIEQSNFSGAMKTADGLLERLYGDANQKGQISTSDIDKGDGRA